MGEAKTRQQKAAQIRAEHDAAVASFTDAQSLAVSRIIAATVIGVQMEAERGDNPPKGAAKFALINLIESEAAGVAYNAERMWMDFDTHPIPEVN